MQYVYIYMGSYKLKSVVIYPAWGCGSTPVLTNSCVLASIFHVMGKLSLGIATSVVHFLYPVLTRIAGFGPEACCLVSGLSLWLCLLLLLLPSWCHIRKQQFWQLWLPDHRQRAWRTVEGPPVDLYSLHSQEKLLLLPLCTACFAALSYNLESALPSRASQHWTMQERFVGVHKVQFLSACTTWCKHKINVCTEGTQDALYLPPRNKALTSAPVWATLGQFLESHHRVTLFSCFRSCIVFRHLGNCSNQGVSK